MTSNEIAIRGNVDLAVLAPLGDFAQQIAKTEFVPATLRNRPEAVLACFMTGQELGIAPMQSLRQIDIIEGRPALRAELMRAIVLDRGHSLWFGDGAEFTSTRVVAYGQRKDGGPVIRVEWNMDMAKKAGLDGKKNWRTMARQMLSARATSEVCRLTFPDVIAGMGYTKEELEDGDFANDDVAVDGEVVEKPKGRKRTAPTSRPPQARTEAPPEPPLPDDDIVVDAEVVDDGEYQRMLDEQADAQRKADASEQTNDEKSRSRQVVRLAKALKLDHHPVVSAVTNGVKDSATRLTADEANDVMNALRGIEDGRLRLEVTGDNQQIPRLVANEFPENEETVGLTAEDVAEKFNVDPAMLHVEGDEPPPHETNEVADPEEWTADVWRSFLAGRGVKVVTLLRECARITPAGKTPVGSVQSIAGSGIAAQLVEFVKEQSA